MTGLVFMPSQIELWPIDRLRPYDRNPRMHSDDQVAQLAASIVEFGWTVPVLADAEGGVIAGHGRLMAAEKLGLTEVPVVVLDHLTPAQRRAYLIADNQLTLNSTWDMEKLATELHGLNAEGFELDLLGFTEEQLNELMAPLDDGDDGCGPGDDEVLEPPVQPVSRRGDLWLLGHHRLLCGDSTVAADVQRLMNGERAILFATDPPHLVDYDGTNHPQNSARKAKVARGDTSGTDGNKDWSGTYGITWDDADQGPDLYRGFIRAAIDHALEPNAAWYCWHASRRQAMLEAVWVEMGAFVHQQIIWTKNRGVLTRSFYLWQHEPCLFGWIKGNKPPRVSDDYLSTTWAMPTPDGEDRPDHPTPKPLDCFAIPMKQHVARGGLCYEPFSGSGSQIMAGEQTGRRVSAMEISPQYCDVAVRRWQAATGGTAVLDGTAESFAAVAGKRGVAVGE